MSSFLSRALRSKPRASIGIRPIAQNIRSFHPSVRRAALSESDHSERQRNSPIPYPTPLVFLFGKTILFCKEEESPQNKPQKNDPDERKAKIDHHKDDQIRKQQEGKGHWKGELSSNSEAAVKADRDEISNAAEDIGKLQKETEEAAAGDKGR
ncbi:MAG: hypothetical protein LQ345_002755 [Seirophora villosa]|nr:MAG: hypothetical protein LQ345_002755 [Seirophora villosa]